MMSWITGQPFNPLWEEKLPFILRGLFLISFFIILFVYFYHKYFWHEKNNRRLFFISVGVILFLVIAKYILFHFSQGYVSDRMFFYALPSPRVRNMFWFFLPVLFFLVFLRFRRQLENLPEKKFLVVIFIFFVSFSLSVAGIRDGVASIADPLTRTYWEYTGSIPLVNEIGVKNFLGQFNSILPELPVHTQTHPPGYVLFLFFWQKLLPIGYLGLSTILVFMAGLIIFPLFYLWKRISSLDTAKKMLQIFVFTPSLVMFSATSMEAFFILVVWLSITLCFWGWKNSWWLSAVAGVILSYCVFSNFLFLLLAPFFLFSLIHLSKNSTSKKLSVVAHAGVSLLVMIVFFAILRYIYDYSIIDNFFLARMINTGLVESNFLSLGTFLTYMFMNIVAFLVYLGVPSGIAFFSELGYNFKMRSFWGLSGAGILLFFLVIGIFQGEVERIWLFLVPFFVISNARLFAGEQNNKQLNAVLSLLFFQIIVFQVMFYTYW